MERLEAALEKARQERQTVRPKEIAPAGPVSMSSPVADKWAALREAKLTPRWARRHRITTLKNNRDSAPYDLLRSRALRLMNENNWVRLAVTSPTKNCGKTTVSTNLAISLARQPEIRILVLDLDLRRPSMQKILGQQPENSLHEVLAGDVAIEKALVRFGDNLAFGLNKTAAVNPSELLQSKRGRAKLDEIQRAYAPDIVLFDVPPMLASDEVVGLLPIIDCGLLVGAADNTTIKQLDVCEKELADLTNVLGVVLNKCRLSDGESGYDYEYY